MTPKIEETAEQKQARLQAANANLMSTQQTLDLRTSMFQRIRSPRISLAASKYRAAAVGAPAVPFSASSSSGASLPAGVQTGISGALNG